MSMDYDVLIIGGGAAGKDAAFLAARAGLETLLIEKEAGRHFLSQRLLCDSGLADVRRVVSGKWVLGEESGEFGYWLWVYNRGLVNWGGRDVWK